MENIINKCKSVLKQIWNCTNHKRLSIIFEKFLFFCITLVFFLFIYKWVIPDNLLICDKLAGVAFAIITTFFITYLYYKTILIKWIWDSQFVKRICKHYTDFRYVWLLLLSLTLGLVLLCIDWRYGQYGFIALISYLLWILLDVFWGQTKIGKYIKVLVILLFASLALIFVPISTPGWIINQWWCRIMLIGLTTLIILRPMNAVYGLMGTSGSIRLFFFNFVLISLIFSSIYYFGFFKTAGITYDVNQPHIDFMKYAVPTDSNSTKVDSQIIVMSTKRDTVYVEHQLDSISYTETIIQTQIIRDTIMPPIPFQYQPIDFWQVWRSTILTTLTQESADLFSIATVHNEAMESTDPEMNKEKSELFEWILIFHIIISWIFFGVFISLLYNKFRYES